MRKHRIFWDVSHSFVLAAALILLSCAFSMGHAHAAGAVRSSKSPVNDGKNKSTLPGATALQAGGAEGVDVREKVYTGKPISLDLVDADLRNVLRLISELTGSNIVIEPDVTGRVTLKVEQVPWDQVLDMVLSMNDLDKEEKNSVIRVATRTKFREEARLKTDELRAKQALAEANRDQGELSTIYLYVSFAKAADISNMIEEKFKSKQGMVGYDARTGMIIYTDFPGRIANARHLVSVLDRALSQVLIEARIVSLRNDVKKNLGMKLGFSATNPTNATVVQNFAINGPPTADFFTGNISQLFGKTLLSVDLTIQALETANELRIMAAPRVLTLNNVKAVISQGVQIPYLKVGDTASGITGTEFKDAVLELQVTPHITPDRKIRMSIEAKQDEPSATVIGAQGQPGIDTRKISTELLVEDGNIIVIGGIIRNRDTLIKSSTPGLSQVPLLGRLFRAEESETDRNELLIFISPRIVEISTPFDRS